MAPPKCQPLTTEYFPVEIKKKSFALRRFEIYVICDKELLET